MQNAESKTLKEAKWITKNIINDEINQKADLVLCDYVLNEINSENRKKVLEKLKNVKIKGNRINIEKANKKNNTIDINKNIMTS